VPTLKGPSGFGRLGIGINTERHVAVVSKAICQRQRILLALPSSLLLEDRTISIASKKMAISADDICHRKPSLAVCDIARMIEIAIAHQRRPSAFGYRACKRMQTAMERITSSSRKRNGNDKPVAVPFYPSIAACAKERLEALWMKLIDLQSFI